MHIIITDSFKKRYKKILLLVDLIKLTNKIKIINLILLKYPYLKLKITIWWIAIRGVLLKTKWWNWVFLIICLKKDKNCWYNLTFDSIKKEIEYMEIKVLEDIKNKNFEKY